MQLKIEGRSRRRCAKAQRTIAAQLERLSALLDEPTGLAAERAVIAASAQEWAAATDGAFDVTDPHHLATLTRGWILDQASDRVTQLRPAIDSLTLSAGADALRVGSGETIVAVGRDDARIPPTRIRLAASAAMTATATAMTAARAADRGDNETGDFESGPGGVALIGSDFLSATVVAESATSAAALASALLRAGLHGLDSPVAWMTVGHDGQVRQSPDWTAIAA